MTSLPNNTAPSLANICSYLRKPGLQSTLDIPVIPGVGSAQYTSLDNASGVLLNSLGDDVGGCFRVPLDLDPTLDAFLDVLMIGAGAGVNYGRRIELHNLDTGDNITTSVPLALTDVVATVTNNIVVYTSFTIPAATLATWTKPMVALNMSFTAGTGQLALIGWTLRYSVDTLV